MNDTITFTRRQFNAFLHFKHTYSLNYAENIGDIIEGEMGEPGTTFHPKVGWVYLDTRGVMLASIQIMPNSRTVTYAGKTERRESYKVRIFDADPISNSVIEEKDFDLPVGITGIDDVHGARGYVRNRLTTMEVPAA